MSTIKVNSIEPANAGSEDYFLARAWVNFNGTGTVAIRDSGNVSTLTDNGTGRYTVNLTNVMSSANYASFGSGGDATLGIVGTIMTNDGLLNTTSSIRVGSDNSGSTSVDIEYAGVSAFGDLA